MHIFGHVHDGMTLPLAAPPPDIATMPALNYDMTGAGINQIAAQTHCKVV